MNLSFVRVLPLVSISIYRSVSFQALSVFLFLCWLVFGQYFRLNIEKSFNFYEVWTSENAYFKSFQNSLKCLVHFQLVQDIKM